MGRHTGYRKRTKPPKKQEPNEITEMWRDVRHDAQERRAARLPIRTEEILAVGRMGYRIRELTPYQFRVNERLDLFPTRRRWHDIKTQARGGYRNAAEFCRSVLGPPPKMKGEWDMASGRSVNVWTVRCNVCQKVVMDGTGEPPAALVFDSSTELGRALEQHMREGTEAGQHLHEFQTIAKMRVTED